MDQAGLGDGEVLGHHVDQADLSDGEVLDRHVDQAGLGGGEQLGHHADRAGRVRYVHHLRSQLAQYDRLLRCDWRYELLCHGIRV